MKNNFLIYLFGCLLPVNMAAFGQSDVITYSPKATQLVQPKAKGFVAGEVTLLNGPFFESQEAAAKNLLSLDVDRLLAPFVIASGAIPKQPMYLGWETFVLPGVALSFYLSGVSRMYRLTAEKVYADRLNYVLDELDACQKRNDGYLLGTLGGKNIFTRIEKEGNFPGFGVWGRGEATPYYSLEKLMSGLRDAYRITNHPKALEIAVSLGNWLDTHMAKINDNTLQKLMHVEYGGMNWVLSDLYADTNDSRFLKMSNRWHDSIVVVPMTKGIDVLNGQHANMQFPKIAGLAARYPYSGKAEDLAGAAYFWDLVVNHRSYVTGGNSESEYFGPKGLLKHTLTPFTTENCNEYNMLRLTKLLFEIEPNVKYADYMERTLFNHILAAQNTENGQVCYFLPLMPGAKRDYQPLDFFSCCTASGLDSYTRHAEYIYNHSTDVLYVNLFVASKLNWAEKGLSIRQETNFPDKNNSTLTVTCNAPQIADIAIRNPFWVKSAVTVRINGAIEKAAVAKDGYFHLQRTWKNADKVEIELPMSLRTESMPDDKNMVALFFGPVLLAADLSVLQADELVRDEVAPALVSANMGVDKWLKPHPEPLSFVTTVLKPEQVKVMPLYRKKQGEYAVYWNVLTEKEWVDRVATKQSKLKTAANLDAATIDLVSVSDSLSEISHHLFGSSITGMGNRGILENQKWRKSIMDSMGYELKVSASDSNTLFVKYMGRASNENWNCAVTVDGKPVKVLKLRRLEPFTVNVWQDTYSIPLELTKGKTKVTVAFEPLIKHKMQMPRPVEIRTLKQ